MIAFLLLLILVVLVSGPLGLLVFLGLFWKLIGIIIVVTVMVNVIGPPLQAYVDARRARKQIEKR